MERKVFSGTFLAALGLVIASLFFLFLPVKAEAAEETIRDNVYIGSVNVGGMTAEEASAAIDEYIEELNNGETVLVGNIGSATVSNTELGISYNAEETIKSALSIGKSGNLLSRYKDIRDTENQKCILKPNIEIDTDMTRQVFSDFQNVLVSGAVDYGLKHEGDTFTVTEGQEGTVIDEEASILAIQDFFASGWSESGNSVNVVTKTVQPKGSAEELAKVKDLLGSYTTDYSSSTGGRITNVERGTELLNGHVVYPGEEFSVHDTVNPMNEENGFALAGAYENGATVESYGGGICQVSSTLYNAVLMSELEVVKRSPHSMIVSYVDPSRDAAIAGDYKDFIFKNNTDAPIYIEGTASGGFITFKIYGQETRDPNRTIEYVSETVEETEPGGIEYRADNSMAVGQIKLNQTAHSGKEAVLYKIVYENGEQVSKEQVNSSSYAAASTIYNVGTYSSNQEAVSAITNAIESQDGDTIQAVASSYYDAEAIEELEAKEAEGQ